MGDVLFLDSFDHYTTAYLEHKYHYVLGSATISAGDGRNGTNALVLATSGTGGNAIIRRTISQQSTIVLGAAIKIDSNTSLNDSGMMFYDIATAQLVLRFNLDGTLSVKRGTTTLATSSYALLQNVYYYIEFKAVIHPSAGSIIVKVGEVEVINETGLNTSATGNAYATVAGLSLTSSGGTGITIYADDLYISDGDFLGDIRVEVLLPTANGTTNEWTPEGAGSNYLCVNNNPPDGDTTYVHTDETSLPKVELYAMSNLVTAAGDIYAVQTVQYARKDDADAVLVTPGMRIGTVNYFGSDLSITETYKFDLEVFQVSPATAAAFTVSEVNSAEFGFKRSS